MSFFASMILLLAFTSCAGRPLRSAPLATVISCNDGDTCKVQQGETSFRVRLSGIDAPETGQEYSSESKAHLESLVKGKEVTLACHGRSWKRRNCSIQLEDLNIQEAMVMAGWAVDFPKYSRGKYTQAESLAKREKRGMWKAPPEKSPYCTRNVLKTECADNPRYQP